MDAEGIPVVFIHGLWLHRTSWDPWIERFRSEGYDPIAPGWPGEAETVQSARQSPETVAGYGIDAVAKHYSEAIAGLPAKPIVIGHSFGGLLAQRLLGENFAAAAIAIDPAPPKGVVKLPFSALRVASTALRNPANRTKRSVRLTRPQFRYGFGNAVPAEESDELFDKWTVPSPGRPLFEAAAANLTPGSPAALDTGNSGRGPLLLMAGGRDHTVPASTTRANRRLYRRSAAVTDLTELPDRGHSLTVDHGWVDVANTCITWLRAQGM